MGGELLDTKNKWETEQSFVKQKENSRVTGGIYLIIKHGLGFLVFQRAVRLPRDLFLCHSCICVCIFV